MHTSQITSSTMAKLVAATAILLIFGTHIVPGVEGGCGNTCSACLHEQPCTNGESKENCDWCASACRNKSTYASDVNNCGSCGVKCSFPHAQASCSASKCLQGSCETNYGDCDSNQPGCETSLLTDVNNCGSCGTICSFPQAQASCSGNKCVQGDCDPHYADCDSSKPGCETAILTDVKNCGSCGHICSFPNAQASCSGGVCYQGACSADYLDCDAKQPGCETAKLTDVQNCGQCGNVCSFPNAEAFCSGGVCHQGACSVDYVDCDAKQPGCETAKTSLLTDVNNCGKCGNVCNSVFPNAQTSCSGGTCEQGACFANYADCDAKQPGCETALLTDAKNCGGCGKGCPTPNSGTVSCVNGACIPDECIKSHAPFEAYGTKNTDYCSAQPLYDLTGLECCVRCLFNQDTGCNGPCFATQWQPHVTDDTSPPYCYFLTKGGCADYQQVDLGRGTQYTTYC